MLRHMRIFDSSNVSSVAYDDTEQLLEIEFMSGAAYQYRNVDPEEFCTMIRAESIGSHVSKVFVQHPETYPVKKVRSIREDRTPGPIEPSTVISLERMRNALEVIAQGSYTTAEQCVAAARNALGLL